MKQIFLWQGYHSQEIQERLAYTWERNDLLICCPPNLMDFSFASKLPKGTVHFCGRWNQGQPEYFNAPQTDPSEFSDQPVLGVFTTGTTRASPKLVLFSKKNIMACGKAILELYNRANFDTVFCLPQPYHVFGLLLGYALSQYEGLRLIAPAGKYSQKHLEHWLTLNHAKTLSLMTPTHLRDLARVSEERELIPNPTYSCIIGGAAVSKTDWLVAKNILNIQAPSIGYGCTEASPGITHLGPGVEPNKNGDIGKVLNGVTIALGKSEADGYDFGGPSLCLATIENKTLTFPKSMHVNDAIERKADGHYFYKARTDLTLNRGGEKFSLEQMENTLKSAFGIEAICVALKDDRLGQELGILAKRPTPTLSKAEIYEKLEQSFGKRFNPQNFKEVISLPLNDNHKVDRKAALSLLS